MLTILFGCVTVFKQKMHTIHSFGNFDRKYGKYVLNFSQTDLRVFHFCYQPEENSQSELFNNNVGNRLSSKGDSVLFSSWVKKVRMTITKLKDWSQLLFSYQTLIESNQIVTSCLYNPYFTECKNREVSNLGMLNYRNKFHVNVSIHHVRFLGIIFTP